MDYFFGFDNYLSQNIDWFFNFNHFMLIIMVAAFIAGCYFLLSAKSEKGKKITKLVLAGVLFILEIGRIIYLSSACAQWRRCKQFQLVVEYFFPDVRYHDLDNNSHSNFKCIFKERKQIFATSL